ncbi:MAG: hypothetical protein J5627_05320, partial [Bacilli bacterium]|nr:hypothetical protein [Bacilli bacterium]
MIKDWKELFDKVAGEEYSASLHRFLDAEYDAHVVYPPRDMMFQAFKFTNPKTLKVVVIGQDPYHNPGEAMGMSFSVPRGIDIPPSLISNAVQTTKMVSGDENDFEGFIENVAKVVTKKKNVKNKK